MNEFKKNIFKRSTSSVVVPPSTTYNFSIACDAGAGGGANCCPIFLFPQTFYCADNPIVLGSIIYEGAVGGDVLVGANLWHKEQSSGKIFRIDNEGVVIGVYNCIPNTVYTIGISQQNFPSNSSACANYTEMEGTVYSNHAPLTNNDVLYTDSGLTTPFNGGGLSYVTSYLGSIVSVTVDSSGVITSSATC